MGFLHRTTYREDRYRGIIMILIMDKFFILKIIAMMNMVIVVNNHHHHQEVAIQHDGSGIASDLLASLHPFKYGPNCSVLFALISTKS